jgi:hypothetical protein
MSGSCRFNYLQPLSRRPTFNIQHRFLFMFKKIPLAVLITIAALLLIILVYVYFQNKLEAMDKSILTTPPS